MSHSATFYNTGGVTNSAMSYSHENTPVLSTNMTSRKRKVAETITSECQQNMKQTPSFDASFSFNKNGNFLSSTMNESIANELERCNLDSFASNYYVERSDIIETPTSTFSQENRVKEPSTPIKSKTHFISSTSTSPMQKLGSPERNEILYPSLQRTGSTRFNLGEGGKRYSPAKKRLFERKLKDPICFFWNEQNQVHEIVVAILSYLNDEDLFACSRVSKNWRNAIIKNSMLNERVQRYTQNKVMNKENYLVRRFESSPVKGDRSFSSPFKENESPGFGISKKFYEITNLRDGQHLERCQLCGEPSAVVESNISQCSRSLCGFIRCLKCNSISTTGPKDFIDKCHQSSLLIDEPKSKFSLMLSPPRGVFSESGVPSFFLDDSYSPSLNTSGYVTDSDPSLMHSSRHSDSFSKMCILQSCNLNYTKKRGSLDEYSPVLPVVPLNLKQMSEVIEPSSPPKVKEVACSKKSKRNLKRLRF